MRTMKRMLCVLGVVCLQEIFAETLSSPLKVAHCRAKCLNAFWNESDGSTCLQSFTCNSCWDQCQRLGAGWSETCDHPQCDAGCLLACRFHLQLEVQRSPVLVTRGQEVILVSGDFASWPPPPPPPGTSSAPHVFVLMCRLADHSWTQVSQTVELSRHLPGPHACATVRVMVVGVDGLVTVYSPAPRSRHQDADLIMRSLGREVWTPPVDNRTDEETNDDIEEGWRMREVSLIHQGVLVIAEVSWEPRGMPGAEGAESLYLVTWELEGGGLKGNLLTDSTCVTLSLWPDTVYKIQVQLFRAPQSVSEPLVLDTRQAAPLATPPSPHSHLVYGHPGFEGVAGVAAALLLFLLVVLLFSGRSRDSAEIKVAENEKQTCDRFKLFPPPVRLLLDTPEHPVVLPLPVTSQDAEVKRPATPDVPATSAATTRPSPELSMDSVV